jgi:dienelactone hydrolase
MRSFAPALLAALALLGGAGCARSGPLESGLGHCLLRDLASLRAHEPGHPGRAEVQAEGISLPRFPIVLYRPRALAAPAPAVVFLPGRFAPEDQYESYARALASRGFVVAVRGRYSWFHPDEELAREAVELGAWLRARADVDPARIAVAGHSMGGRNAIRAAVQDGRFDAVVAIDPGTIEKLPHASDTLARLRAPLLIIGAEEAWRGWEFCGRQGTNYAAYFDHAPAGTALLEIVGADHVQVMDSPDLLGYQVCRVGHADSTRVRLAARGMTVQFLSERLQGAAALVPAYGPLARWRVRGP